MKDKIIPYLRNELKREPEDESLTLPQKAKRGLVWFFALFLALTLLSRCASDALVARVTLKEVGAGSIDSSVAGTGVWSAADARSQWSEYAGLRVQEVFVTAGANVAAGDALYSLERQSVEEVRKEQERKIQQYNLQISQLYAGGGGSAAGAELSLRQAQSDLSAAESALSGAKAVIAAQKQQALTDAQTNLTTQTALRDGQLAQAQSAVDAAHALTPADPAAVTAAEGSLAALQVQWSLAITEYQQAVTAAQSAVTAVADGSYDYTADLLPYQQAVDAAKRSADTASVAYDQAVQSANSAAASSGAAAGSIALSRDAEKEKLAVLDALLADDCIVRAKSEGTVTAVNVRQGELTGGDSCVTFSTEGLEFSFQVKAEQAQGLKEGDAVILYKDGKAEREKLKLKSISAADAEENCTLVCATPDGGEGRSLGAKQEFRIERSTDRQEIRVPIQALREDGSGKCYVLIMGEKSGVMGVQNVAVRVDVTLLSHDENYAALEGGLGRGDKLIVSSDKPIADGDAVEKADE